MVGQAALDEQRKQGKGDVPPNAQYFFSEEERNRFRDDPEFHLQYRKRLESAVNNLFEMFLKDTETNRTAEKLMREEMHRRIGPGHEELKEKLIPSWPPGCRRITPGDGYLEALVKPSKEVPLFLVLLTFTQTSQRSTRRLSTLFLKESWMNLARSTRSISWSALRASTSPSCRHCKCRLEVKSIEMLLTLNSEVKGVDGVSMADEFNPEPQVYLATTVPKFPNYFVINGVRGNWAAGTALPSHEVCVEYVLKCAKRMQAEGIKAMEVRQEPVDQLYQHIDLWHARSVWGADCKSWYKNNIIGGKLWIWGGSALHFMKTIKEVKYEHYNFRYRTNMWEYLGNGQVEAEIKHDLDNLTPYMRNQDIPWDIR